MSVTQSLPLPSLPSCRSPINPQRRRNRQPGHDHRTLTGTDFNTGNVVLLNGTQIPSTYISATTLTASFFAAAGTGTLTVSVLKPRRSPPASTFTVSNSPQIVFTPHFCHLVQQSALTFQLVNPYSVDLAGTLSLTFAPTGVKDSNVQFAAGGRGLPFNIPADLVTTPLIQLQTGTVAGTATISLAVVANGVIVTPANLAPVTITIPAAAPTITSTQLTRNGNSLTVAGRLLQHPGDSGYVPLQRCAR